MGLFKRRSPGRDQEAADEALPFMTVTTADAFRTQVHRTFGELGIEVTMHPDHAVDDLRREFGLWNLATQCVDHGHDEWPAIIRRHVETILASMDAADPFDDAEPDDIRSRTLVRLYPEDMLPSLDAYPHRELAPGVVEMLALDLPETVTIFDRRRADEHGGWEALHATGIANLRALPAEAVQTIEGPDGARFHALLGDSVHTASRAVLLPELIPQLTGEEPGQHGWLMSVPNRHQVVWHVPHDHTVLAVASAMAHFAYFGHRESAGAISPHLYWWNGVEYEQLTQIDESGAIAIHAGPRFVEVLDALVTDD